jgi:hypothetical protein
LTKPRTSKFILKRRKRKLRKCFGFHILRIFFSRLRFPGLKHKNKMKPFGKESTIDVLGVLGCLHQLKIIHLL